MEYVDDAIIGHGIAEVRTIDDLIISDEDCHMLTHRTVLVEHVAAHSRKGVEVLIEGVANRGSADGAIGALDVPSEGLSDLDAWHAWQPIANQPGTRR